MSGKRFERLARALALAVLATLSATAGALQSDKEEPIGVEADSVDIDEGQGVSVYKGNVEVTQGSIHITAEKVTVTHKKGEADLVVAEGTPVTFQQQPDGDKGLVRGRALRTEYRTDSEVLLMIGEAVLTQGKDSFRSDRITYDRARAVVKAGAAAQGKERVKITIQSPRTK